ncbi:MAG: hypothetical protein BroJett030_12960 [Alphaproteobacteria bacterium]|nr:MAG: hypothetical protein BroJett030_12960 [Alphaproteobacteria bacterium]
MGPTPSSPSRPEQPAPAFARVPLFVALTYGAVSGLWILFSDGALLALVSDHAQYQTLQTYKGWFFVSVTALLLFLVLRAAERRLLAAYQRAVDSERRLELALSSAGGGYWDRDLTNPDEAIFSPRLTGLIGLAPGEKMTFERWKRSLHPDDAPRVAASAVSAVESNGRHIHDLRYRLRTGDGSYRWMHSRGNVICDGHGKPVRMIGIVFDVTAQVEAEARIERLIHYDAVTGLANCATFLRELDARLAAARASGEHIGLAQITIADFNDLIEQYSAKADRIVQAMGEHLRRLVGADGLAGRLSQDSFLFATPPCASAETAQAAVARIVAQLDRPVAIGRRRFGPFLSVGAALGPDDGDSAHVLVANAGRALAQHRPSGPDAVQWYAGGMDVEARTRSQRLRDLRGVVKRREMLCHFQPIIGLASGRTIGLEALARWNRPGEGLVPPDQFIALAEESGAIHEIGADILAQACRQARAWTCADGPAPFIAVNVSPHQLDDPRFPSVVERVLADTGLAAGRLELEVTENGLVNDVDAARERLAALRRLGVSVAMDDFGTGYSSLSNLSRLPFSRLKIDRDFVSGYGVDGRTTAIVNATLHLCNAIGLDVTAEGIETAEQAQLLGARGVQAAQGFYFSRPIAVDGVGDLIDRRWAVELPAAPARDAVRRRTA